MSNEPVTIGGVILGLVTATLALLMAFGLELSQDQVAAILGFTTALIAVITFIVRSKVTPTSKLK